MGINGKKARVITVVVLLAAIFLGYSARLIQIQIVDAKEYAEKGNAVSTGTVSIPAARGEILDRNGNPLVVNRQANSVIINAAYFPSAKENGKRNPILLALIQLLEAQEELWNDNLPLALGPDGKIVFAEDRDKDIAKLKSKDFLDLNDYATAQNCFDALVERYELQSYNASDARKIASVRYEMERIGFSLSYPLTLAEDVSQDTVLKVKENSAKYKGADIGVTPVREYADGTIAPHILGVVGAIDAEEYAQLKSKGYKMDDTVGKSGIEKSMEEYLRGTPGEKVVAIDKEGNVKETITKQPQQGNSVILTIDKDLQKKAQEELATTVTKRVSNSTSGAVVMMNVNTGEVLAAASYPTYNLNDYRKKYAQLSKDKSLPLWNRFAMSSYAPGSTLKPCIAMAGLEEGVITNSSTFACHRYLPYKGHTFQCTGNHGSINVGTAIEKSCNIYFYNVGMQLGIDRVNEYCKSFGLGESTGIEIPESTGIIANPTFKEKRGATWYPGDTLRESIGQGDSQFTMVQMANYCATVATGGTRHESHLVKSIKTYDYSQTVLDKTSVPADMTPYKAAHYDIIRDGMHRVATKGGPSSVLSKLKVSTGAKTGTSQIQLPGQKKYTNGFLITFAPYDNPEVSTATFIEKAGSGASTAQLTAGLYDYYFSNSDRVEKGQDSGALLK